MIAAERAAAPLLPDVPPRRPGAPGQSALANQDRVQKILAYSGWSDIDIAPIDVPCAFPEAGLIRYFTRLGPVKAVDFAPSHSTSQCRIKTRSRKQS
jgi:hypothetical protein